MYYILAELPRKRRRLSTRSSEDLAVQQSVAKKCLHDYTDLKMDLLAQDIAERDLCNGFEGFALCLVCLTLDHAYDHDSRSDLTTSDEDNLEPLYSDTRDI